MYGLFQGGVGAGHVVDACYKRTVTLPQPVSRIAAIAPVVVAATAFAFADVATKVTLHAEADVLTMALFRGLIGVPLLMLWITVGPAATPLTTPVRRLALFIGVLFAGNVFFLFKAIEAMEVPLAILTYFTYPLLTGLAAAATGIERLGARADDQPGREQRHAEHAAEHRHGERVGALVERDLGGDVGDRERGGGDERGDECGEA